MRPPTGYSCLLNTGFQNNVLLCMLASWHRTRKKCVDLTWHKDGQCNVLLPFNTYLKKRFRVILVPSKRRRILNKWRSVTFQKTWTYRITSVRKSNQVCVYPLLRKDWILLNRNFTQRKWISVTLTTRTRDTKTWDIKRPALIGDSNEKQTGWCALASGSQLYKGKL